MKVLVNGCSHTAGTFEALDDDFSKTWPSVLRTLGFDVTDMSWKGCSNDRILRTSTEQILTNQYAMAVIQWTFPKRFETPEGHIYKQQLANDTKISTSEQVLLDRKFVQQLYFMQLVLEANNVDYLFIVWRPIHRAAMRSVVFDQINTSKILNYIDGQVIGMDNILHDNGFVLSKRPIIGHEHVLDMHYMADAHKFIADTVCNLIDSR